MAREMKDSGIEWIGDIPYSWKVYPARYAFSEIRTKNTDGAITTALKFFNGTIIQKTNFDAESDEYVADTITNYTIVKPDTIMINGLNLNYDLKSLRVGLVKEIGVITSAYLALWPDRDRILPEYATYLFKGYETKMAFHNMGAGIRKTLGFKEFKRQPILIPDMPEQQRIVSFLDSECSRIDSVIEQTRASIEEYKKLKQVVITKAVTKGVRGDRPMKDSGVDWIGEIPEDWCVTKLKHYSDIRSGITLGKIYPYGTKLMKFPYLRVANVKGGYLDLTDIALIDVTKEEAGKYRLHDGELLMTEGGDRDKLGRGTVWHGEIPDCLHQNHVFALRTNPERLLAEYVAFITDSFVGRDYFDVTANQSVHLASTNSTTIMEFVIPFPSLEEQQEIIDYLRPNLTEIQGIVENKELLLKEIDAFKKALIYEYVTGKKEVPQDV